jgi:hypothetical protein
VGSMSEMESRAATRLFHQSGKVCEPGVVATSEKR